MIEPIRDIEDSADQLDTDVGDSVGFWARKQKEIVSSVVDYNLSTLVELVADATIDLDPKYQRRFR